MLVSTGPMAGLDTEAVARRLEAVRERTLALVAVLDWPTLRRQHVPILSPMVWDLGHIANFEELWLGQRLAGLPPFEEDFGRMFDAVLNPRPTRDKLPLPEGRGLYAYLARVREQSLDALDALEAAAEPELARGGFIFELIAEHEEQHQETLLQAMQLLADPPYSPAQRRRLPPSVGSDAEMVEVAAGPFLMGWDGPGFAYDNERGRHPVELPAFSIDRTPVTDGDFLAFVEAGGYQAPELWSEAGWRWRQETGAETPGNWLWSDGAWHARFMDRLLPLPQGKPVVHVCFHEAEAYARFVGKRLPTEAEWEKAALWDPEAERPRPYPWGSEPPTPERANLDQLAFEPAEAGAYPDGASAYGVEQAVGDVWEWTASDFTAYPGFAAYPYPEYSQIFFGSDYKVLRGGSWATRPAVARGTFRNWDFPIRRQIFAGFRCAQDG
jgi:gamma-glutamyl hercynylcysteine S-oxide synthase